LADAGASLVVALDPDAQATREAARQPGVLVCRGDGTRLPFPSGCFEAVASFETIEHIEEDVAFVAELRRVLAPGGTLMLSTPNAANSSSIDGRPENPFHVREYTPGQLTALLRAHFDDVSLLGQRARPAYEINPYWQQRDVLSRDRSSRIAFWSWRLQNRLPFRIKDGLSRLLHRRGFYPGEHDWVFTADAVDEAHVVVALCR
jgi:SAM-dependent methyltransferase